MGFFSSLSDRVNKFENMAIYDAFGRQRVSQPYTLWDSKLLGDNRALSWDDVELSGGGTGSDYTANHSSVSLSVSEETAGVRVRQTKQRFNYQPGKSHLIFITATLGAGAAGITRRVGYFDTNNGVYFQLSGTTLSIVKRSYRTGQVVNTVVASTAWDLATLSNDISIDTSKSQIFVFDMEWLGVGSVRAGIVIDGAIIYLHQFNHANEASGIYMTTPNLPIRYELINDGTGGAATLECICSSVMSEGGAELVGNTIELTTVPTHVDANAADSTYAIIGYKLKSTHLDNIVKIASISIINEQSGAFRWSLLLNPTVAGTGGDAFTYNDVTNTPIQVAYGDTLNTVTGGHPIIGDLVPSGGAGGGTGGKNTYNNLIYPGSTIAGTADAIVLCATPLAANADIQGTINLAFL